MIPGIRHGASCSILLALLVGIWCQTLADSPPQIRQGASDAVQIMPGFVVIKFKAEPSGPAVPPVKNRSASSLAQFGVLSLEPMFKGAKPLSAAQSMEWKTDISRISIAAIPKELDPVAVASNISRLSDVEYAEPRYIYHLLDLPNDSLLLEQDSYFTRMSVYNGWSLARGDPSVIIATVDGGTYWRHEDLLSNLWINSAEDINHNGRFDPGPPPIGDEDGIDNDGNGYVDDVIGWNFTTNSNNPDGLASQPSNFAHGTATASIFGATTNNRLGLAGTGWHCRLMPICAASPTDDKKILAGVEGIFYAYINGAKIISCSWGGAGSESKLLQDVLSAATEAGALVVAAAGNDGMNVDSNPFYPANSRNVLAVGATQSTDDSRASFSNFGIGVPVFAPGVNIWSARKDGTYGNAGEGTSYSTPLVAGLAGLLASAHPFWTPRQIAAQIRVTADLIDAVGPNMALAGNLGHGRVNFFRALADTAYPGIEIVASHLHAGLSSLFFSGDTVALSVTIQNVLFVPATGLQFTAISLDSTVTVLQGSTAPVTLQPGQQLTLPEFTFRISSLASPRFVVIRLAWLSNGMDYDATPFRFFVLPEKPQWTPQESPTSSSLLSVRTVDPDVVWAAGGNGISPVVLRTTDGGHLWSDVTGDLSKADVNCVEAIDSTRAWAGNGSGEIIATTDGGRTWVKQPYAGTQASSMLGIRFLDATRGFALGNPPTSQKTFVVLNTTDGGASWTHLPSEPTGVIGEKGGRNSFCWTDLRHGWFGTNQSRVWRTTDGGRSWTAANTGFWIEPSATAKAFSVAFADSLRGMVFHPYPFLALSSDGGVTWAPQAVDLGTASSDCQLFYAAGTSFAWLAHGQSIYKSSDGGVHWSLETSYPFAGEMRHLSFVARFHSGVWVSTGWAVTSGGEILKEESLVTDVRSCDREMLPSSFALLQNFPNPFNPTTAVRYQLPVASLVLLSVYDLLGREVAVLVNERKAPGSYEVKFDAAGRASGVYLYRLTTGDFVETRKMILVR